MGFLYYKTFEKDALADGASYEDSWVLDEAVKIKRVHIVEKADASLSKSTFYFKDKKKVRTHAVVPANVLGPTVDKTPELDLDEVAGEKIEFTLKNMQGAAISVFISFECWEP